MFSAMERMVMMGQMMQNIQRVDFVVVLFFQQGLVDECNEACCDGEHQYVEE